MMSASCILTREEFRKLTYGEWNRHLNFCEYCRNYEPKKYYSLQKPSFKTRDMIQ